jgi:tetratricopeptide (TPR) repeat protein
MGEGHPASGAEPVTGAWPATGGLPSGDPPGDGPAPDHGEVEPEQALARFPLRLDDQTLREVVDEPWSLEQIRFELTKKLAVAADNTARARLAGLRAVTSRLLGKLEEARDDGELALQCALTTGSARRIAIARTRLARVLQWRGEFDSADEHYQRAVDAAIPDRLRAAIYNYFGTSCYEQGRFLEALQHFETSLALHPSQPAEQSAMANRAFAAITLKAGQQGFGPFPRTRAQVLHDRLPPQLRFHDVFRRYGYAGPDGDAVIPPTFIEAYPFSDGVAWVRPDDSPQWTLIDTTGQTLIPATGYQEVGPFREGLAWVLADPVAGWFAIDTRGTVVVRPAGYEDAAPFHAGLAAVARDGRWGAVDRTGREVVPPQYDGLRTATSDGAYLTGFTSEGLAVVERGGLVGVIDRTGTVLVPISYQQIEVHPVGYLVLPPPTVPDYSGPFRSTVDLADGWGAMDRRGDLVVDPVHPDRAAVLVELEGLLRDVHPIL